MRQIIAIGGGGLAATDGYLLERYIVGRVVERWQIERPNVLFLPQAGGENSEYVVRFYRAFTSLNCRPTHLSLFTPHTAEIETLLLEQHLIYVGGGNTKSMLALWREWGLDHYLKRAYEQGIVLTGVSAGAICWFEHGVTDSIPGQLTALPGLGFLPGSCTPHYDSEVLRRPTYQRMVSGREIPAGYAFDDGTAGHFVDETLLKVVSARPAARGYHLKPGETPTGLPRAVETTLPASYLGA
jgi:peptidase E